MILPNRWPACCIKQSAHNSGKGDSENICQAFQDQRGNFVIACSFVRIQFPQQFLGGMVVQRNASQLSKRCITKKRCVDALRRQLAFRGPCPCKCVGFGLGISEPAGPIFENRDARSHRPATHQLPVETPPALAASG